MYYNNIPLAANVKQAGLFGLNGCGCNGVGGIQDISVFGTVAGATITGLLVYVVSKKLLGHKKPEAKKYAMYGAGASATLGIVKGLMREPQQPLVIAA